MTSPVAPQAVEATGDDVVLPFRTTTSGTQGRIVHLGAAVDEILAGHDYPEPVSRVLGEALALTALLGSILPANGRLILQTQTDGPLRRLVVNFTNLDHVPDQISDQISNQISDQMRGQMRGLASFDSERLETLTKDGRIGPGHLMGVGHMAMTIDPGGTQPRTQGIVAMSNHVLEQAAYTYFRQSEQIPTFVRLAVARIQVRSGNGAAPIWRWRAGGLIVQHLPDDVGERSAAGSDDPRTAVTATEDDTERAAYEEDWNRVRMLASTVEDHELLDPTLSPERLLYRLFADEGVRVLAPLPVRAHCGCSRQRVEGLLKSFGAAELSDMREPDGGITVTCEYCNTKQHFAPDEVAAL